VGGREKREALRIGLRTVSRRRPSGRTQSLAPGDHPACFARAAGERVRIDLRDGLDRQITPTSTTENVLAMDMRRGHPLNWPLLRRWSDAWRPACGPDPSDRPPRLRVYLRTAGCGNVARPRPGSIPREVDDCRRCCCELRYPGVRIPAAPFLGVVGVAPSAAGAGEVRAARKGARGRRRGRAAADRRKAPFRHQDQSLTRASHRATTRERWQFGCKVRWTRRHVVCYPCRYPAHLSRSATRTTRRAMGKCVARPIEMQAVIEVSCEVLPGEGRRVDAAHSGDYLGALSCQLRVTSRTDGPPRSIRRVLTTRWILNVAARNALLAMQGYLVAERGFYSASGLRNSRALRLTSRCSKASTGPNVLGSAHPSTPRSLSKAHETPHDGVRLIAAEHMTDRTSRESLT